MIDYRSLTARETAERLSALRCPTVIMHARPDGDTVGSCAALIKILGQLGISAEYACADTVPARLSFLLEGETRSESLDGRELIAVDVASKAQLGTLSEYADKIILTIDHHEVNSPFSDNLTTPRASSAAEAVYDVLDELISLGKAELTCEVAYPLYAAISSDTGGFMFSSASSATYRRAAALIDCGIDFSDINHRLFHSKSPDQIRAEGYTASKIKTACNGKIAYATLSYAELTELRLNREHFETAIEIIRSVENAEIALFVRENADKTLKASMRSTGANVASVAAEFGGGGHIRAAGCSPVAESAEDGAELLISRLQALLDGE